MSIVNAALGIAQDPQWLYEEGLRSGNLQLLLSDYVAPQVPIQVVYLANRLLPKRAIVFMDFMADVFAKSSAFQERLRSAPPGFVDTSECPLLTICWLSPRQLLADSCLFSTEGMIINVRIREVYHSVCGSE